LKLENHKLIANGPNLASHTFDGSRVILRFENVGEGLETREVVLPRTAKAAEFDENPFVVSADRLTGFEIAGSDGSFIPARARIVGENIVELQSDQQIQQVRYAYSGFPLCNLYKSEGLPSRPLMVLRNELQ
jgi:sialate O-acetylesterase